jgi:endoglycosylceramidase
VRSWCLAAATALVLSCSTSGTQLPHACTVTPPSPPDWRLTADGTLLRDGLGRVVFLRGVDAGGRSKFAPYVPFDYAQAGFDASLAAYMDRAASWGIDAMRVPFTWTALEPTEGTYDMDWMAQYQQIVDAAWARGIWSVVDFHQDVYSESYCGDGFPGWTIGPTWPPYVHDCPDWQLEYFGDKDVESAFDRFWASGSPVQAQYLAAWDVMIARFQDEPGVLGFEPFNEPAAGSQSQAPFEATTLTDFFSMVVPHMRGLAPSGLVFVDAPGVDSIDAMTSMTRPTGDGIVFAPHYYPISAGQDPSIVLPGLQGWAAVGAAWNVPVLLGEFGITHDSDNAPSFMEAHFQALDTLGMSGTEWEYSVESEEWDSESDSVVAADGTEYPVAQALIRPFARAVAGGSIVQSWDPDAGTFALSYVPATGGAGDSSIGDSSVTEVQLPARAYPSGMTVAMTGGCYDTTSSPGRMLLQPDPGATSVSVTIAQAGP